MSSGKRGCSYSRLPVLAAMLAAAPLLIAAERARPRGQLLLDAADPVVMESIAGVTLRLRVDPAEHGVVLLNRAAATRLPLRWQEGAETDVGRVSVTGRVALATMLVADRAQEVTVATYDRDCCLGVDGAIGPDTLPYAVVRWSRANAPDPTGERTLALRADARTGLYADAGAGLGNLRLAFTLYRSNTVATAAGGAMLAGAWGGTWAGPAAPAPAPFGLVRPERVMAFARPGTLAGFPFARISVRIADFGGRTRLPQDRAGPDDILVAPRLPPQEAWPAVILGDDLLRRCAEIVYVAAPRTLTLRCAFDATADR